MAVITWQRPSPDRRTVTLADSTSIADTLLAVSSSGWQLWSAHREGNEVVLVLCRGWVLRSADARTAPARLDRPGATSR